MCFFAKEAEGPNECVDGEEESQDGDGQGDSAVGVEGAGHAFGGESFGEDGGHEGIVSGGSLLVYGRQF
jgi:hypothetical protein